MTLKSRGTVDEFRVIFDIIDSSGSGELDLLGVKRACGLMGHKSCMAKKKEKARDLKRLLNINITYIFIDTFTLLLESFS